MKISQKIYEQLLQLPKVPPETGGILGSKHDVIDKMIQDSSKLSLSNGVYVPNVSFLNHCIEKWTQEKIAFQGIFHTHALNWTDLSTDDKAYIVEIMRVMPATVMRLYFPLVFPSDFITAYVAEKENDQILIKKDVLEIVGGMQ